MIDKVRQNEDRINEIMAKAKAENRALTQSEADEINRIQSEMMDTGVMHLSETEIEYRTIMNRMKDNSVRVSLEQASEIIKNAQSTRDEAIAAAETQYAKVELEAERMLNAGRITEEEYKAMIDAAAQTRDETIAAANEQYDTIYNTTTTSSVMRLNISILLPVTSSRSGMCSVMILPLGGIQHGLTSKIVSQHGVKK